MQPVPESHVNVVTEATPLTLKNNQQGHATQLHLVLNLIAAGLGSGILALPWSTAGASVIPALSIIGVVMLLNAWTISIVVEAGDRHQTFDLGSLLGKLPGRMGTSAQAVCNTVLWVTMFLCLVSYVVVITDSVQAVVNLPREKIVLLATLVVLPLCYLDQSRLSVTSALSVFATLCVFGVIVRQFLNHVTESTLPPVCFLGLSRGALAMFSAMMQTIIIQMCVLPMYSEMQDRTPAKFNRVVVCSFFVLSFMFASFAVVGYETYGRSVRSNILLELPTTSLGLVARLSAAAAVTGVFPIILNPMIASLKGSSFQTYSPHVANIARVVTAAGSGLFALYFHDLGRINVVNGAISCWVFVAVIPCVVGLYLLGSKSESPGWRGGMYLLAALGTTASIMGLIVTDNHAIDNWMSCMWYVD
uniref:Amino acid transporter transmembrane domain-containing protein n=1 Tax=Noctiluca scintillans TaxID=2966 RepID=A0A7S1AVE2_NOCSC